MFISDDTDVQVSGAEQLLWRMQAHYRLCNLLCPPFTKAEQDHQNGASAF